MSEPPPGAVVIAGTAASACQARISKLLAADPRFSVARSIADAIQREAALVVVPETGSILEESDLIARVRTGAIAGIFLSDDDHRRVSLLRAGATDVLSGMASDAEILCRIERGLEASLRARAEIERQHQLESLAYTDGLTGLANRRFFDEILKREVARANRYRRPMSLVLIDLDHFKRVNDLLGHSAGDEVLVQLARQLRLSTRTSDCAARIGGDEFAAVLGDIDASGARIYALRVAKALDGVTPLPGACDVRCALSIGIASYGLEPTTPSEMLRRADRALYRAKSTGRGRIEIESW